MPSNQPCCTINAAFSECISSDSSKSNVNRSPLPNPSCPSSILLLLFLFLLLFCSISLMLLLSRTGGSNNILALPPLRLRWSTSTRCLGTLCFLAGNCISSSRRRRSFRKRITSRGSQPFRVQSRQRGRRLLKGQRTTATSAVLVVGLRRLAARRGQVEVARLTGDGVLVHVFGAVAFVREEGFFHEEGVEEGVVGCSACPGGAGFVGRGRAGKALGERSGGS